MNKKINKQQQKKAKVKCPPIGEGEGDDRKEEEGRLLSCWYYCFLTGVMATQDCTL
jgi:hypothetical protein